MLRIEAEKGGKLLTAALYEDGTYKVYPKSANETVKADSISSLEELAVFLIKNPSWGVRMKPGYGIVYDDIIIYRR